VSKVPGTEFVGDGSLIQPLILDLVSETGPECYAVFADGMNALRETPFHPGPHAISRPHRDRPPGAGRADAPRPARRTAQPPHRQAIGLTQ
jgi:hypothetical protein